MINGVELRAGTNCPSGYASVPCDSEMFSAVFGFKIIRYWHIRESVVKMQMVYGLKAIRGRRH